MCIRDSDKGLKQNGQDFFVSGNEIRTENAIHTFTETPDIFERSAQVLHLGAFKQYSELLDWHEQAGGMDFTDLPLMNLQYTTKIGNANPYMQDFNPPVYPGVGYPSLSLDSNGPVSYTHLDVYKRQHLDISILMLLILILVSKLRRKNILAMLIVKLVKKFTMGFCNYIKMQMKSSKN